MTGDAIIQARMSSSRLPGKVLRSMAGKPMLSHLIERLRHTQSVERIIIATSLDPSDDDIVKFCAQENLSVFRGSLNDVAGRILEAAQHFKIHSFFRICGDSPLLDPKVVDQCFTLAGSRHSDITTNCFPKKFPAGQSVEFIQTETLSEAYANFSSQDHYEHVTRFFYEHPQQFHIASFGSERDLTRLHMAVDTEQDFQRTERILKYLPSGQYDLDTIVETWLSMNASIDEERT